MLRVPGPGRAAAVPPSPVAGEAPVWGPGCDGSGGVLAATVRVPVPVPGRPGEVDTVRRWRALIVLGTTRFPMVPDTSVTNVFTSIDSCAPARLDGLGAAVLATGGITPASFLVTRHLPVGGAVEDRGEPAPTTRPGRRPGPRRRP